jgi:acyl-CoA thioester hydrolase
MAYEFKITRRVEFAETDMAGIMHFSNFFRFMEAAEGAFLRSLGLSVVLSKSGVEVCMPRVHAECDYTAPLKFEDEVLVHLLVEKKGTRSITYRFRFYRQRGAELIPAAEGRVILVCARRTVNGTLKAVPLPEVLAKQLQEAPSGLLSDSCAATAASAKSAPPRGHLRALGHARGGGGVPRRQMSTKV